MSSRIKPCSREGCHGKTAQKNQYCSYVCKLVNRELVRAQRICESVGNSPATAELWAEAVAFSDAWSNCQALERRLYRQAASVGITSEQWQAIRDGT